MMDTSEWRILSHATIYTHVPCFSCDLHAPFTSRKYPYLFLLRYSLVYSRYLKADGSLVAFMIQYSTQCVLQMTSDDPNFPATRSTNVYLGLNPYDPELASLIHRVLVFSVLSSTIIVINVAINLLWFD